MAEKWRHDPENQPTLRERIFLGAAVVGLAIGVGFLVNERFDDDRVVNPGLGNPTSDIGVVPSNETTELHGGVRIEPNEGA